MTITYRQVGIKYAGTTIPITFKIGAQANFNLNAQVVAEMEKNDEAIMVPYNLRTDQQTPTFTFSPSREDARTTAVRLGRLLSTASTTAIYPWQRIVNANSYAAATTGTEGFGATANDTNAIGAVLRNGVSVELDRVTFATFDATVDDQFGLGANGALALSNNLIGSEVVIWIPYPVANATRLGLPAGTFQAIISAVQNDRDGKRKIAQLTMPQAQVNIQESGQIANGDPAQMSIVDLSGSCTIDWKYFTTQPAC